MCADWGDQPGTTWLYITAVLFYCPSFTTVYCLSNSLLFFSTTTWTLITSPCTDSLSIYFSLHCYANGSQCPLHRLKCPLGILYNPLRVCIEPIIKCIKKKLNRRTGDTRVDAQEQSCNIPPENNTREQEAEARERRNRLSSTENPIVGQPARETPICRPENTVNLPYMNQNTERIPIAESRERNERLRNGETLIWREPTDYSPGQTISLPLENQIGQEEAEARESSPNRLIYRIIYPSGHVVNLPHMNQNSESLSWISTDESQERRASRLCSEEYHIIFTEPRHFSSGHTVSLPLENNIVQEEPDFTTDQQPIYTICAEVIEELPTNNDNERREEFQPDVNWTLVRELSNSSPLPPSYDDVISRPPPSYDETLQ